MHPLVCLHIKQGPVGQRCVHEAHIAHLAHVAHLAHSARQAHSAMSMLDCPNDFHIENGSFSAFKKKRVTDGPTDTISYRDARTHLKTIVSVGIHKHMTQQCT